MDKVSIIAHTQDLPAKVATAASYSVSGGLVVADTMNFLNNNAGAMGFLLGFLTLVVNIYFQKKRLDKERK